MKLKKFWSEGCRWHPTLDPPLVFFALFYSLYAGPCDSVLVYLFGRGVYAMLFSDIPSDWQETETSVKLNMKKFVTFTC